MSKVKRYIKSTYRRVPCAEQARRLGLSARYVSELRGRMHQDCEIDLTKRAGPRLWDYELDDRVDELLQDGATMPMIAQELGISVDSLRTRLDRRGVSILDLREKAIWTAKEVARMFGVGELTVRTWIERGWLSARVRTGEARTWRTTTRAKLEAFCAVREAWPFYSAANITDAALCAHAQQARERAGGRWMRLREYAVRNDLPETSARYQAERGRIPGAQKIGRDWFVWTEVRP